MLLPRVRCFITSRARGDDDDDDVVAVHYTVPQLRKLKFSPRTLPLFFFESVPREKKGLEKLCFYVLVLKEMFVCKAHLPATATTTISYQQSEDLAAAT